MISRNPNWYCHNFKPVINTIPHAHRHLSLDSPTTTASIILHWYRPNVNSAINDIPFLYQYRSNVNTSINTNPIRSQYCPNINWATNTSPILPRQYRPSVNHSEISRPTSIQYWPHFITARKTRPTYGYSEGKVYNVTMRSSEGLLSSVQITSSHQWIKSPSSTIPHKYILLTDVCSNARWEKSKAQSCVAMVTLKPLVASPVTETVSTDQRAGRRRR